MSANSIPNSLVNERYLNLETFRRDGSAVQTPVWFAEELGGIIVFTDGTSYKVKRLQRNQRVRVAACNVRGTVHGPWIDGTARIVESNDEEKLAYAALVKKYGWQMRALNLGSWLARRIKRR